MSGSGRIIFQRNDKSLELTPCLRLSPPELHHSGRAAQGAATRAGRVLHQPHDQVRRIRLSQRRPGLHLLLQRPLRRERLINRFSSTHPFFPAPAVSPVWRGRSKPLPLSFYILCSYHFFLFQILTLFPFSPSPSQQNKNTAPERLRVEGFAQIVELFGRVGSSLISARVPFKINKYIKPGMCRVLH